MAGYFTQRRPRRLCTYRSIGNGPFPDEVREFSVNQTTYSYRSSRPEGAEEQTYSDLLKPLYWSPFASTDNGHEFYTKDVAVSFGARGHSDPSIGVDLATTRRYSTTWKAEINNTPMSKAEYAFLRDPDLESKLFPALMSKNDIIFFGKKAIAATAPTRPEASFSTFAAEFMRDGLPSLMLSSIGSGRFQGVVSEARKVSQDALNLKFGWAPLVNDFKKLLYSVQNSYSIIEQYKRDSGRIVRRGHSFPDVVQQESISHRNGEGIISPASASAPRYDPLAYQYRKSVCRIQRTQTTKVWFRGAYEYYIPVGDDLVTRFARYASYADKLLGVAITPEVIWNAAPWSWLLDWIADIGTTLEVQAAFQSNDLVIKYGYLMKQTSIRYMFHTEAGEVGNYLAPPLASVITGITKERYRATPYGFGLDPSSFDLQQWGILGAIATGNRRGVSK